ncbi:MAG TPA: Gfo/Idh/MocA family oxidoreductase [Thermoanaerobaculia bacterium]|jgi:predicted dehydrogenase|nr:Gfo/Idh/MocA family oxidoreductase [Thermoanaerobaculia bacterium]
MTVLRGAIIGLGNVAAQGHLPGWKRRADATITAAVDSRPDRRDALAAAYPNAKWYDSVEDLFAVERENLDFVDICTPPAPHASLCRSALSWGLHVLCEKPLVLAPEELRGLPLLSAEREKALVTVHNWKHAPVLRRVTELVKAGAVGDVRRVRWETHRREPAVAAGSGPNWRTDPAQSGGGVLADHGWHAFYSVTQWMPGPPRTIAAQLETRRHHDFPLEDTADLFLAYADASAEVFLTWAENERRNRVEIAGTRGSLSVDGGRLERRDEQKRVVEQADLPSLTEGSHHPDWFDGVIDEFFAEARREAPPGRNLAEATLCANLVDLAKESSRQGGQPLPVERLAGSRRRR